MIRQDTSFQVAMNNIEQFNNKQDIRQFLLMTWAQETISTKYRYFVDTLTSGQSIYLERPGRLNKGCDFVIFAENALVFGNGNDMPPSHNYILDDLRIKKNNLLPQEWNSLLSAISAIHSCNTYETAKQFLVNLPNIGLSYELILKLLRWFFIEQDLTYWSGVGRDMLHQAIQNV